MSIGQGVQPPTAPHPPPSPSGGDVLLGLGLSGVLFLALAFILGFAHEAGPDAWLHGSRGLLVQLVLANAVLAAAAAVVAMRRGWRVFRFQPLPQRSIAFCAAGGAIGGISLAYLLTTLSETTGWPLHGVNEELMGIGDLPSGGLLIFAIVAAGTTPLAEELIFRGLLFQWLRERIGPVGAALISAVLFGALHWPGGQAIWAGTVGFALALLFHRLGSLWAPIAAHAGNNAVAIVLVLILVLLDGGA